ncbi:hypothetical protein VN12_14260 [Pirellula sp. SH-Sr6A]|nr:hypothetical protein VN12_14260 [Pirellula sp. SH-Sr6A]
MLKQWSYNNIEPPVSRRVFAIRSQEIQQLGSIPHHVSQPP